MFERMNRYVVRLSPQELRHAQKKGVFKDFVEAMGAMSFWKNERVFSDLQLRRMKAVEFSAELAILLIEGPQDKKSSIDLYYGRYERNFADARKVESRLASYIRWLKRALPDLAESRYRKPVDFYSLIGALDIASDQGRTLSQIDPAVAGQRLLEFEQQTKSKEPQGAAAQYVLSASRQTDNILPRINRINTLAALLQTA